MFNNFASLCHLIVLFGEESYLLFISFIHKYRNIFNNSLNFTFLTILKASSFRG